MLFPRFLPCFALFLACALDRAQADVKLPAIFTEHMVLQREVNVPVWGSAEPQEQVTVTLAGQTQLTHADAEGRWIVKLPAVPAGGPVTLTVRGKNTLEFTDVLMGDVWLCGGQSNMERQLGPRPPQPPLLNWEAEVAAAHYPMIRHFGVAHKILSETTKDVTGSWVVCSPETVKDFTAVGYFFGRELHQQLKVPIGLLHSSWGGTGVATWTSAEAIEADPVLKAKVGDQLHALELQKKRTPGSATPSALFQSMIAPLIPYAIKGAIWFQGESGPGMAVPYDHIFQVMIQDWRAQWRQGPFPFYFVQLPNGSPQTREAQARALALPHTGMAITLDVGYPKDVHGPDKAPIGQRLARLALVNDYGQTGESSGPLFASATTEGSQIRVTFTHTGGGLKSKDGEPLRHFQIAGTDKKFVDADAGLEGDQVLVSSPRVPLPLAVRYAWVGVAPDVNLFNGAGIPAAPFRTETW